MITDRINFKQPKYILPAILYLPLIGAGYLIIDMFSTKIEDLPDSSLETTEYLNSSLPQAQMPAGDGIGGKYENMQKSFGRIGDFSAVEIIDRDEGDQTEKYSSRYSADELAQIDSAAAAGRAEFQKRQQMQEELERSAIAGRSMTSQDGMTSLPTEEERIALASQREKEAMAELEKALAEVRLQTKSAATLPQQEEVVLPTETDPANPLGNGTVNVNDRAVTEISESQEPMEVIRRQDAPAGFFNTIVQNDPQPQLISAIIDEDIKAVEGSRVRLRLLDDVEIGDISMTRGSYLYATMSGFGSQRVKGSIKSVLICDRLVKVSLSLYDTDGMEGLYVPESAFRETARDVAAGAMSGNMNMGTANGTSISQWGLQAVQNAYQKTTNAMAKAIKKNSAELKYGTFVYLVNGNSKN